MRALILICSSLCLSSLAHAVEVVDEIRIGEQRAVIAPGMEPLFVLSGGYLRAAEVLGQRVTLGAALTAPIFLLDGRHHRLELSARAALLRWRSLRLDGRLGLGEQATASAHFEGVALMTRGSLIGGWFGGWGFAAVEATLQYNPTTYVAPTQRYRERVWAEAPSGWVADAGGLRTLALQGGLHLSERLDLTLRAGVDQTLSGNTRLAPLQLGLGLSLRL